MIWARYAGSPDMHAVASVTGATALTELLEVGRG